MIRIWKLILAMIIGVVITVIGLMLIGFTNTEVINGDTLVNGFKYLQTVSVKDLFTLNVSENTIKAGIVLSIYIGPIFFIVGSVINLVKLIVYVIK